jgi:hypothetical protein
MPIKNKNKVVFVHVYSADYVVNRPKTSIMKIVGLAALCFGIGSVLASQILQ